MPIPRLLHPVPVTLEQVDRSASFFDTAAREPIQGVVYKAPVILQGQVRWNAQADLKAMQSIGFAADSYGYVLFAYPELNAKAIELTIGDRLILVGFVVAQIYITKLEPIAHYSAQGGPTLLKAWCNDRSPARSL